jgi:hypothetical protein
MRVFIQDGDVDQLDALERELHLAGHEPVTIYSLTEVLDMASHPHLAPDAVVAEARVITRTLRRLGESTAGVLRDLLADRLLVATGVVEDALPLEVGARLPRPIPIQDLQGLLGAAARSSSERRNGRRKSYSDSVEVHLHNGGSYGPFAARFMDLSLGGACVRIPPGVRVPSEQSDATVDLWVHDGHLCATRLHGRLAWAAPTPANRAIKVGVEFFELSEAARTRIETALFQ